MVVVVGCDYTDFLVVDCYFGYAVGFRFGGVCMVLSFPCTKFVPRVESGGCTNKSTPSHRNHSLSRRSRHRSQIRLLWVTPHTNRTFNVDFQSHFHNRTK